MKVNNYTYLTISEVVKAVHYNILLLVQSVYRRQILGYESRVVLIEIIRQFLSGLYQFSRSKWINWKK